MKFNIKITDIEKSELNDVIKVLNALNDRIVPHVNTVCDVCESEECECQESTAISVEDTICFDKEGLQWDERIHSSNRKLTAKGVWQRRKNITDEYYNQIKNELLGIDQVTDQVTDQVEPAQVSEIDTPVQPTIASVERAVGNVSEPVAPVPPMTVAPVVAPAVIETPVVDCATLYQQMFEKVKLGFGSKSLDANYIQAMIGTLNATLGTNYMGLAEIKDDENALKFVINDLVAKGL